MKNSSDYFTEAFNRSLSMMHQIDTQKRLEQQMQLRTAMVLMKLKQMQQQREFIQGALKDVPGWGVPNVETGDDPISRPEIMTASPLKKSLQETYGAMYPIAEQALMEKGDFSDLAHIPKPSQASSLDALIAKAAQEDKQDELDRLIKIKQRMFKEGSDKTPTPPFFKTKIMGPNLQQDFKYNPETGEHDIPYGKARPIWRAGGPEDEASKENKESIIERRISAMAWDDVQAKFGVKGAHIDPITGVARYPEGVNQAQIEAYYKERFAYHKNKRGGSKKSGGKKDPLGLR